MLFGRDGGLLVRWSQSGRSGGLGDGFAKTRLVLFEQALNEAMARLFEIRHVAAEDANVASDPFVERAYQS